jgi:predicted nucleic acid-binding protein
MSASITTATLPNRTRRAILADAGPLFAAIDDRDQHHGRARQESDRLVREQRPVIVVYPTLGEVHRLLLRHHDPRYAITRIAELRDTTLLLTPSTDDVVAAIDRLARYSDQPISLFDALLAVMSDELGLPVWTYDHHFDVMGVAVWR